MQASVRELKAQLSRLLRQVEAGATVTVRAHDKPVARIVPIPKQRTVQQLRIEPGLSWNGGKPRGIERAEAMPEGVSVADWVGDERR